VHVRITSPPVSRPCFYGIDFATRTELLRGTRHRVSRLISHHEIASTREGRIGHRVGAGAGLRRHRDTRSRTTAVKNPSPSGPGPESGSIACSGWGIKPDHVSLLAAERRRRARRLVWAEDDRVGGQVDPIQPIG
jgi:hypothetical protein